MRNQQTYATGLIRPKSTALFFDKLWVPYNLKHPFLKSEIDLLNVPKAIRLESPKCASEYEKGWFTNVGWISPEKSVEMEKQYPFLILEQVMHSTVGQPAITFANTSVSETKKKFSGQNRIRDDRKLQFDIATHFMKKIKTSYRNQVLRNLVVEYAKEGKRITPIYLEPGQFEELNVVNDADKNSGLEVCLDFMPDVSEEKLTWEQVIEFRGDKKAKEKLRRFRQWFEIELLDNTEDQIVNILAKKLEDYEWALKKHGILTTLGGSTSVISCLTGPQLIGLLSSSALAAIAGGVAIGAGVVAWVGKKIIEKKDIERDEIAYIYEVNKILS